MSRHRSEPPADWLPSADQAGYAPPADGFAAISHRPPLALLPHRALTPCTDDVH
jgi:hypothetical protein